MAYLEPNIDADGIHVSGYSDTLDWLIGKYKEVFGQDVYIGEETKDYQLLSIFAKCMSDIGELVVDDYNARNPNYATGESLDLLLPLVSMSRLEATASTVVLTLSGTEGTVIPEGSQVVDSDGNLWSLTESVTLDSEGTGEGHAACDELGAIMAPIGTITEIATVVEGWDGVTNEVAATAGRNLETDAELRERRKEMVSIKNNGGYDALHRAVLEIGGVTFVDIYVNDTDETDTDKGIPAHSFCTVVSGGDDDEIAEIIWKSKAPGIGTAGTTTRIYVDQYGHSNTIKFTRPTSPEVAVDITLTPLSNYDSTRCEAIIREAIKEDINNLGIGKDWSVTMAYKDIYNAFAGEDIPFTLGAITGAKGTGSPSSVSVSCSFNEVLITSDEKITITETNA